MTRRVVITGAGCITPLGCSVSDAWRNAVAGVSGSGPITLFDASDYPVKIAAEASDWDPAMLGVHQATLSAHARQSQFAAASALQANADSGLENESLDPSRQGVVMGCGEIFPDLATFGRQVGAALATEVFSPQAFIDEEFQDNPPHESYFEPGSASTSISAILGTEGICLNYTVACVSSSLAMGEAAEMIKRDDADIIYAGGAHSMIHPLGVTGFHRLSTLSTRNEDPQGASRPFERDRDGFVVGEGASVLVLEELEHALRRNAKIYGELTGYGITHDAYRVTDPHPEGREAGRCIHDAISNAGITTGDIDYINAHGSGTVVNDKVETGAIKRVFGDLAGRIPISSTKSMTGHLTTACGSLEALFCLLAIRDGMLPPTINYHNADPLCDLDYVPNEARAKDCRHVLTNNLGFGGQNVALVLSRYENR